MGNEVPYDKKKSDLITVISNLGVAQGQDPYRAGEIARNMAANGGYVEYMYPKLNGQITNGMLRPDMLNSPLAYEIAKVFGGETAPAPAPKKKKRSTGGDTAKTDNWKWPPSISDFTNKSLR